MPAIAQYQFDSLGQWKNAGEPKLIATASMIVDLGYNVVTKKYHVEAIFLNSDNVPNNGLLSAKAVEPLLHQFIGHETFIQYEERKKQEELNTGSNV